MGHAKAIMEQAVCCVILGLGAYFSVHCFPDVLSHLWPHTPHTLRDIERSFLMWKRVICVILILIFVLME